MCSPLHQLKADLEKAIASTVAGGSISLYTRFTSP
jgi:hypothetical protein